MLVLVIIGSIILGVFAFIVTVQANGPLKGFMTFAFGMAAIVTITMAYGGIINNIPIPYVIGTCVALIVFVIVFNILYKIKEKGKKDDRYYWQGWQLVSQLIDTLVISTLLIINNI